MNVLKCMKLMVAVENTIVGDIHGAVRPGRVTDGDWAEMAWG